MSSRTSGGCRLGDRPEPQGFDSADRAGIPPAVKDERGRRVVPRGELERVELLNPDGSPGDGVPRELVIWRDLYEHERQKREEADAHARELDLIAIANAGPIRALRLRRQLRAKLAESRPSE